MCRLTKYGASLVSGWISDLMDGGGERAEIRFVKGRLQFSRARSEERWAIGHVCGAGIQKR